MILLYPHRGNSDTTLLYSNSFTLTVSSIYVSLMTIGACMPPLPRPERPWAPIRLDPVASLWKKLSYWITKLSISWILRFDFARI